MINDQTIMNYARFCSGKLLLRQELPFSNEEIDDLIRKHYLAEIPGIIETWSGYRCNRCGNEKNHLFGIIPRACASDPVLPHHLLSSSEKSTLRKYFPFYQRKLQISNSSSQPYRHDIYCRKCIEMGRVSTFEPLYRWDGPSVNLPTIQHACRWRGKLTPFQKQAANRIRTAIQQQTELLVWAVCGAGKTEMLYPGLNWAFSRGFRVCLATPRTDVVTELYPRLQQTFPSIEIVPLYGGTPHKDENAQLVIATTHQLLRYNHAFDVMVIDEIDAFPFHADPMLPHAAGRARKPDSASIYLTATPRPKMKWKFRVNLLPAVFVPARYHGHPLPVPQFVSVLRLRSCLKKQRLPEPVQIWLRKQQASKRQLLIFVPTVEDAHLIHSLIPDSKKVFARSPERKEVIEQFRLQKIQILVTTTILERGVTFPSVDVAVIDAGHNVFDEAALVQISGRAGRSADDPFGEVVFFYQNKTSAMVQARRSIQKMNQRAKHTHDYCPTEQEE
ncbi:competence protein ComFA [Melghiribacillus thermohalophilus]|uniref:Competence protein ComFA n=1 Tax=Melghiribacillus thermohalophilus TaxID=1324956 RepID=A0A4R3MXG0_9BACI|nr:helicase-related protein [Melghiribacillus thermohalophilus]TCT20457.1 competence protein ComFA [Melghiribacillus thermohalophilus]